MNVAPSRHLDLEAKMPMIRQALQTSVSFLAGGAFGLTSVVVGQPLDTVKTRMQARPDSVSSSAWRVACDLLRQQGPQGLYRGGLPIFFGGAMFRSAQFGISDAALRKLRKTWDPPSQKFLGFLDWQVAVAGCTGGFARGVLEAPFDQVKISRQVEHAWSLRTLFKGSGITLLRNTWLFGSFTLYRDLLPHFVKGDVSPFLTGAICSNLAWLTIWPLDVIKSQRQSGNYESRSSISLLREAFHTRRLFRGLLPGLARSTVANGCAMMAYKKVEEMAAVVLSWTKRPIKIEDSEVALKGPRGCN